MEDVAEPCMNLSIVSQETVSYSPLHVGLSVKEMKRNQSIPPVSLFRNVELKIISLTEGFISGFVGIECILAISIPSKARFRFGLGSHAGPSQGPENKVLVLVSSVV